VEDWNWEQYFADIMGLSSTSNYDVVGQQSYRIQWEKNTK